MNLYERYVSGDTITVYAEIASLREEAFNAVYYGDVVAVLEETFKRTSYNLSVIYEALLRDNYHFKEQIKYNFDHPLLKPLPNVEELLNTLDEAVKPFGFVPLSIKTFYRVVGSCNFAWDYTTNKNFRWNMADPIQVVSLDDVVTSVTDKYWHDDIRNYVEDENFGCAFLELSADDLHKDNVSGGAPYSLEITKRPSVDSHFLNEPNNTTFINYLRICMEHCGFPGMGNTRHNNDYQNFFDVKPQLKAI